MSPIVYVYFLFSTVQLSGIEVLSIVDAGDLILMPGLVDSHVHVNEPGIKSNTWEHTKHLPSHPDIS